MVMTSAMIRHFLLSGIVIDRNKAETTEDQTGGGCSEAIPFCVCLPDPVPVDNTNRSSTRNEDAFRSWRSHPELDDALVHTGRHGIFLLTYVGRQTQPPETLQCLNQNYRE